MNTLSDKKEHRLPRCKPEEQQITSSSIDNFLTKIEEDELELHSIMIIRNGHVIMEGSWSPYGADNAHLINSLSKSFTSTAIGLAIDEGLLSIDDCVISFFPEELTPAIAENLKELKVYHLLTMSTGHAIDTMPHMHGQQNWIKAFLEIPIEYKPGTHFLYNTGASYMLSAILHTVSGENLLEFLQPRLFEPLKMSGISSMSCPRGINTGGFGMYVKIEDIAKFGMLYLQEGIWEGKRILPKEWVLDATTKQISNGSDANSDWSQGYGYQFWRCRHGAYRGDGAFGQFCIVIPEKNVVVAITSGAMEMQTILNHVWESLLPGMGEADLSEIDLHIQEKVEAKIKTLAYPAENRYITSIGTENWNGKQFKVSGAEVNIETISFQFEEGLCSINLQDEFGAQQIIIGMGSWIQNSIRFNNAHMKVSISGNWRKKNLLEVHLRFLEHAYYDVWNCHFVNDSVRVSVTRNVWIVPGLSDDALLPTFIGAIFDDRDMWIGNGVGRKV